MEQDILRAEGQVVAIESPTGQPLLSPKLVPYLIVAIAVAEAVAQSVPPGTLAAKIAHGFVTLGALLGLASPGLRRR